MLFLVSFFSLSIVFTSTVWLQFLYLSIINTSMSLVLLCVVLISLQILLFSLYYIKEEKIFAYFIIILLVFVFSILILILRNRVLILFLG